MSAYVRTSYGANFCKQWMVCGRNCGADPRLLSMSANLLHKVDNTCTSLRREDSVEFNYNYVGFRSENGNNVLGNFTVMKPNDCGGVTYYPTYLYKFRMVCFAIFSNRILHLGIQDDISIYKTEQHKIIDGAVNKVINYSLWKYRNLYDDAIFLSSDLDLSRSMSRNSEDIWKYIDVNDITYHSKYPQYDESLNKISTLNKFLTDGKAAPTIWQFVGGITDYECDSLADLVDYECTLNHE